MCIYEALLLYREKRIDGIGVYRAEREVASRDAIYDLALLQQPYLAV